MSKTFLWLLILFASCGGSTSSFAADGKLSFALCASGQIKYPILGKGSRNYHLFGAAGFGAAAELHGSSYESMSFLSRFLLIRETTGYHHVSSSKYFIETVNLLVNPEVSIPTRNDRLKILAGIGLDWMVDLTLSEHTAGTTHSSTGLDAVYDTIAAARRPLIPFVSAGLLYRLHRGLHIQIFLRQDLRDAFPDETVVTFGKNNNPLTVNLSHQPTRLGLGLMYIF